MPSSPHLWPSSAPAYACLRPRHCGTMRCSTLLAIMTVVLLYLVMGALVFRTFEMPKEMLRHELLLRQRDDFLLNHTCVDPAALDDMMQAVVIATKDGILRPDSTSLNFTSRWDVPSAFFFCGTIITTIGFGNLSPITETGQLFCIVYALVGIPMFGILLAGVGDHMGTMLRRAVGKMETLFLRKAVSPTNVRVYSAVLSILIGCVIFLGVPTLVFKHVEDWGWLEAGYFVVITLTTVGFGDYVADDSRHGNFMYKPLVWLWIVFGLAYFASILNMIGNWLRVLSKKTRAEMEELRAYATDFTQNIQNMSVDFRIPVPLDLNDPFQFRRSRKKKRRRRSGPKVNYIVPGIGSPLEPEGIRINGHLFDNWSEAKNVLEKILEIKASSVSRLELPLPSSRAGSRAGSRPGSRAPSRPVSRSELRSLSGPESRPASASGSSSWSESKSELSESASESDSHNSQSDSLSDSRPNLPNARPVSKCTGGLEATSPGEEAPLPTVMVEASTPPRPSLLDFFGENLAYIDESSDTLSDFGQPGTKRACRPKKRSMRRQLPQRHLMVAERGKGGDIGPPSNPPTPPPCIPP
ncbi:potassium channel subfamily K member 2 isoform X1 [Alosa pseudoharengus]|uniref:potassium channel subfamily K member 2 isoform X1 n=2 Tax=Alosa pseudoharengus TaxID=34774 RepID=UPI003F8CAEAD